MVFIADCGDAHLVRKASGTRITLVKKRCAWYLIVKLKPHSELPYAEGEEFLFRFGLASVRVCVC